MAGTTKEERREAIKDLLRTKGEVQLTDLEQSFSNCSTMTLRRDLKYLEDQGFVKRTRGGAVALDRLSPAAEDLYAERALENIEAKHTIAEKALQFVEHGGSIYIDSGTTMMMFTRAMPDEHISVLTSGLNIALELTRKTRPQIAIVGGQVNRSTISVSGANSESTIGEVNIDTAFIAASGYSPENGFTSGSYTESELKRQIIQKARRTVILMDSNKVDRIMAYTFADLDDIDVLVSDGELPDIVRERAETAGVVVI